MISNRIPRRLWGTSAMLAGTVIAAVGLVPSLAAAQGGEVGPHGRLIVEKTVEGESSATFGFHVTCDEGLDRNFTLEANSSKDFDGVRTGSVCVVTETDNGGADSTKITPHDGTVVIGDDDPVTVKFVNVFEAPTTTTTEAPTTTTTTTTIVPTTTNKTKPTVLGVSITAPPAPLVLPAELPRTGNSASPTLVAVGLALTLLGIAIRRTAAWMGAITLR